jgi:hypothetical protein
MLEQLPYLLTMRERQSNTADNMAFRYHNALSNARSRAKMADVSRLSIDPAAAAAIAIQAAATHLQPVPNPVAQGENAFDGAVSALLAWAGSTDSAVVSAVSARGQAVASRAVAGLGELATMNADNANHLGAL